MHIDILMRVTMYIIALELLSSTSNTGVTHQLSERVALLNPSPKALPKKDAYEKMRKAYYFRSKSLHESAIKEKEQQNLLKTSEFLDELCRQLLFEIMTSKKLGNHFKNEETIKTFFHEIISIGQALPIN